MIPSRCDRTTRRLWLAAFAALNALAAWGGAIALVTGATDFGESVNRRLPFDSLVLAGLALGVLVAVPLTLLACSAATGAARTDELALIVGVMLIGWIVVQVVVLRAFSMFQPIYLGVGVSFVAASKRVKLAPGVRGSILVALGAIVTAVGIGLMPHLVETGLTVVSIMSIVVVLAGIALVVAGSRSMLRNRHRVSKLVAGVSTVMVVAVAVWIISPAVAATNVPATHVGSTPAEFGLPAHSVTLTTTDGVRLAAWYLHGTNGAGVVVVHGAGSTRSSVLEQSAALVEEGYGVLLIDARGHGDSHGTAMDFGWYGDLDIAAGTEFLASLPEIDPGRIGVVGFSMGAEEAIGAAANDPRIRAVVAEGATGRQAVDKEWFSETYGWRGWIQERVEYVQYGITDFLTDASPPVPLRAAVAEAPATRFLLITAGTVDDERNAAAYVESGAPDRVAVWNVEGAGHTRGWVTQPLEWQAHVVDFLDENLT